MTDAHKRLGWVVLDMRAMKQAALLYAPDGRGHSHTAQRPLVGHSSLSIALPSTMGTSGQAEEEEEAASVHGYTGTL